VVLGYIGWGRVRSDEGLYDFVNQLRFLFSEELKEKEIGTYTYVTCKDTQMQEIAPDRRDTPRYTGIEI